MTTVRLDSKIILISNISDHVLIEPRGTGSLEMSWSRLIAVLIVLAGTLAGQATVLDSDELLPDDQVDTVVTDRSAAWWPRPSEKPFDSIGWAPDIRSALRLAREHDRPVFLFTMDGRVNTGRC